MVTVCEGCVSAWTEIDSGNVEGFCMDDGESTKPCEVYDCDCFALDDDGLCEACWLSTK